MHMEVYEKGRANINEPYRPGPDVFFGRKINGKNACTYWNKFQEANRVSK